jgi:hypothetical protein
MISDFELGWLGGFFDAEGTMRKKLPSHGSYPVFELSTVNTDETLIRNCCSRLAAINITCSVSKRKRRERKLSYCLSTGRTKAIISFAENIGFQAQHKAAILAEAIAWFALPKKTRKAVLCDTRFSWTLEFKRGWLRGFFDGEGTCSLSTGGLKRHMTYYLSIPNTDPYLIRFCRDAITELGIESWEKTYQRDGCLPCTIIRIGKRESILRFINEVGADSPDKQQRFTRLIEHFNRKEWFQDSPWTPTVLARAKELKEQGMSLRKIVKALGFKEGLHHKLSIKLNQP